MWRKGPRRRVSVRNWLAPCAVLLGLPALAPSCTGTIDAGHSRPHGLLPVDERNPVILYEDDWSGDWLGEYAVLFANTGGPPLAGIVVNATRLWGNLSSNASGWNDLVVAAQASGLKNIPAVTSSAGVPLARPIDGQIDSTVPNDAAGARLIIDESRRLSTPARPVVIVAATSLTDIADAYLVDHTVVDRVVVVAELGSFVPPRGLMNAPNGDMDPWADWIVAHRFRYVQVSAYYDQTGDVTADQVSSLPQNALGARIEMKRPNLLAFPQASDQVALLAVALPTFVVAVQRAVPDPGGTFDPLQGPSLLPDAQGDAWIATKIAPPLAAASLWQMLLDTHALAP